MASSGEMKVKYVNLNQNLLIYFYSPNAQ